MSLHVLVSGTLRGAPEARTSAAGKPFVTCKLIAETTDGDIWCNVIAFGRQADALQQLREGDAVAIGGRATVRLYQAKDGEQRASLSITADSVAAARAQPRKQNEASDSAPASIENRQRAITPTPRQAAVPTDNRGYGGFGDMEDDLPWQEQP